MQYINVDYCVYLTQSEAEQLGSQCNRVVMLITCDASADYSGAVSDYRSADSQVRNLAL